MARHTCGAVSAVVCTFAFVISPAGAMNSLDSDSASTRQRKARDPNALFIVRTPALNLAYCPIPKNGGSGWRLLLQRMRGEPRWHRMASLPHYEVRRVLGHGLSRGLESCRWDQPCLIGGPILLNDAHFTKVAFLRDPLERLLSGYLDKCVKAPAWEREWNCHGPWSPNGPPPTFHEFASYFFSLNLSKPETVSTYIHFLPQSFFCGLGVPGNFHKYDLISKVEEQTDAAAELLVGAGLLDLMQGWPHGTPLNLSHGHETAAAGQVADYYTPHLRKAAEDFFQKDSELLALLAKSSKGWHKRAQTRVSRSLEGEL